MDKRQSKPSLATLEQTTVIHFGAMLKILRLRSGIRQLHVLNHLPNWTQTNYSRVESGELAPAFDQLVPIYTALQEAGVAFTPQDRQQFLTLARLRIEAKKTCREIKSDQEWDTLRVQLSRGDTPPRAVVPPARSKSGSHLLETRHLIGREDWLASVCTSLQGALMKKLIVLQGPTGIGKSSELHRIAHYFLAVEPHPLVLLCSFSSVEQQNEPENALDLLLGTLLAELGSPDDPVRAAPLTIRVTFVLDLLEKLARPILILADNAEQLMDAQGHIASCWQTFLSQFLRRRHHTSLVLATKEWPGWHEGERLFVAERTVPLLLVEDGIALLQQLGLSAVPVEYLQQVSEAVGGVPLCLEWVASLVKKSLWLDSWDELDELSSEEEGETAELLTQRLLRLMGDPALFGGPIADRLTPLLERIITHRLSVEALQVLYTLSLAGISLGKPPLQRLCPRPSLLKELRTVSLLTTHAQRVQVLPMVASLVRSRISPDQRQRIEEQLIKAYVSWLDNEEMSNRETGAVIAELVTLYLNHHRLLDAAELLIQYGWMSFNQGYGPRLARLAQKIMQQFDWKHTVENECGGLLLYHILTPFLGKAIETEKRAADFQYILALASQSKITIQPTTEMDLIRLLMMYHMSYQRFEEAQHVLEAGTTRLTPYRRNDVDTQVFLLARRASLLAKWSDYLEEQDTLEKIPFMREEIIELYRQCCLLVSNARETSPLKIRLMKKRSSAYLNYLGYQLTRNGQAAEALEYLERSIDLGEQGYCNFGALAAAYGDMSQAMMELGRFDKAMLLDEKAMREACRCAQSGDAPSQDEVWIYQVNRGRLYLRLGKIDEAKALLEEAVLHIQSYRSIYRLLARKSLKEIEQQHDHILSDKANDQ
jgi:tetratricopeptide (TPR) repeat protein